MISYVEEHKAGFIGTVLVHSLIILALVLSGFYASAPALTEEGLTVDFGMDENGLGDEEPAPAPYNMEEVKAEPVAAVPEKHEVPKVAPVEEEVTTQDAEKTVVVNNKKKEDLEAKKEKERLAEQERIEKAELQKKEKEQKQISEINARAKNVFGSHGLGAEGSTSTSQGVTYGTGNQGVPTGVANAGRYGPGGGIGNGVSFSLGGRSALSLPKPTYPGNEEGKVVVLVTVDKFGKVTKAESGVKGSTTLIPELLAAAQRAAMQAKFNVDDNAPAFQQGTITYRFVLD